MIEKARLDGELKKQSILIGTIWDIVEFEDSNYVYVRQFDPDTSSGRYALIRLSPEYRQLWRGNLQEGTYALLQMDDGQPVLCELSGEFRNARVERNGTLISLGATPEIQKAYLEGEERGLPRDVNGYSIIVHTTNARVTKNIEVTYANNYQEVMVREIDKEDEWIWDLQYLGDQIMGLTITSDEADAFRFITFE